jgi:agmatine deiminase
MAQRIPSTPRADGYWMPAEFAPHDGCWMLWPERPDNWRLGGKPAQRAFVDVAIAISQGDPVTMGVSPAQFQNARSMLPPHIRVVELTYNDSWMRDCGPTFLINEEGRVRLINWNFNAWGGIRGGLYFPWDQDDLVPQKVSEIERVDRYRAPITLEGGSIHVDGDGTLLTTEQCLLNPDRNGDLSKEEIERALSDYLGVRKFIWLGEGVFNDETSGHVDNLCCFIRPGVVALTWTEDIDDPQYAISRDAFDRLSVETDAQGRKLEIHKIHQPEPVLITEEEARGVDAIEGTMPRQPGDRLAASYINFYIGNGIVVAPQFDDPHDGAAVAKLTELFPDRKIIPVAAREILLGGGNIHCITQQQPKSVGRAA